METKKTVIPVKGMTCVNCAAAIQKDISKLVGVKSANVNFANEKAVVEFDPASIGVGQFITSIHESGYQAVTERVTVPGMMLSAVPPSIRPTLITAGSTGSTRRDTIVWSARTT